MLRVKLTPNDSRKCVYFGNVATIQKTHDNEVRIDYVDSLERVTTDELETIATDIKHHSDTDYDIKQIMYILANDYCLTFIED